MNSETVLINNKNGIVTLTLNIPQKKNALAEEMKVELHSVMEILNYNKEVKVVIITGSGDAFCAGGDLSSMGEAIGLIQGRERMKKNHDWLMKLVNLEKPVIAAVNGPAVGAGFSLALAADILIASENAVFGAPFNQVGLVPDLGCLYMLTRYVGLPKAKELVFTGRLIKAEEAESIGLVNRVVPREELMSKAYSFAEKLALGATNALSLTKNIINRSFENSLAQILEYEAFAQAISYQTEDHKEGVRAFFEKRKPAFKGF